MEIEMKYDATNPITVAQFFAAANGRARKRLFNEEDYRRFVATIAAAKCAAQNNLPYYWERSAGAVASAYSYATTTARMGLYTSPSGEVHIIVDRAVVTGRSWPCAFKGGERSYQKWFREQSKVSAGAGE